MVKDNILNADDEITNYSNSQAQEYSEVCNFLKIEIEKIMHDATSKIYYSAPVWFIDGIPIVGYNATAKYVNLLFWSGQSFDEPELIAAGKFKAAQIKYKNINDINVKSLHRWLNKSKELIWNYKDLPKTHELTIYKKSV